MKLTTPFCYSVQFVLEMFQRFNNKVISYAVNFCQPGTGRQEQGSSQHSDLRRYKICGSYTPEFSSKTN